MKRNALAGSVLAALSATAGAVDFSYAPYRIVGPTIRPIAVAAGDVTGDGRDDVVMLRNSAGPPWTNAVYVYVQQSDGTLANGVPFTFNPTYLGTQVDVAVADMNADGVGDIVLSRTNGLSIFRATGNNTYSLQETASTSTAASLATLDINRDGHLDVAGLTHNQGLVLFFGDGLGGIASQSTLATNAGGSNDLEAADLNQDGFTELVVMSGQSFAVPDYTIHYHNGIDGLQAGQAVEFTPELQGGLGIGDINTDGLLDLVMSRRANSPTDLWLLPQSGTGTFGPVGSIDSYSLPTAVKVADVDADGRDDVVVLHTGARRLGLYRQTATGLLPEVHYTLPNSSYWSQSLAIGDFNNDACADAAIADSSLGLVVLTGLDCQYSQSAPFEFVGQVDVPLGTLVESAPITVHGTTSATLATVSGMYEPAMSINGGPWTASATPVRPGDTVRMRHRSATAYGISQSSTLTLAGRSGSFIARTVELDDTPDAFVFADAGDVQPGSVQVSNEITVSGITAPTSIAVTNGAYSLDGAAFTTAAGTANAGQRVRVQHTAASGFAASVDTTLTIGGASDTYTSTTRAQDIAPDAFDFVDVAGVARATLVTSAPVTVTGIEASVAISVGNGAYSIDGGPFTSAPGSIAAGQSVRLQHASADAFDAETVTTLTVGSGGADFASRTLAQDTTPDAFAFAAAGPVARNSVVTSPSVTIAGINDDASIGVVGGAYSIDGGAFTASFGVVRAGQSVRVQHTSSASFATSVSSTLTVGGVSASFTSTTEAMDQVPDDFAFAPVANAATGTLVTSAPATVTGINTATPVSVSAGGSYSINGGAFATAAGTVVAGDVVRVRRLSSAAPGTAVTTLLTLGTASASFTVTTGTTDTTPNAFAFADATGARRDRTVDSNVLTIGGFNAPVPVSIAGATAKYSINNRAFTSAPGTLRPGETLRLRVTSSAAAFTWTDTTITVGGVADTWSVQTGSR